MQFLSAAANSSYILWELGAFPRVLGRYSLRYAYTFEQMYLENERTLHSMRLSFSKKMGWNVLADKQRLKYPSDLELLRKNGEYESLSTKQSNQWKFLLSYANLDLGQKLGQGIFFGVFQKLSPNVRVGMGYRKITYEDPLAKIENKGYFLSWVYKF